MDDETVRDLARPGMVVFAIVYLAVFTTMEEAQVGWLVSLLNAVAVLGVIGYWAQFRRWSMIALMAGWAGATSAVLISGYALLLGIDMPRGLLPLPGELGMGVIALIALAAASWHRRRQARRLR